MMSAIPCASVALKTMADGTLRISFDVEPMHAQDAFRLFAAPGTPAALAALQVGYAAVSEPVKDVQIVDTHEKPKGGALAKLAGMWANDVEFWYWASGSTLNGVFWNVENTDSAAEFIREICQIDSRAALDHDPEAAELFHSLIRGPYSKHLISRGITA